MAQPSKVYLIGAGPGDPDLISVKGLSALESCDAVVYDHLVSLELIVPLPANVERYYAGKSAGQHSMAQEDINDLLVELAKSGKTVARLKGGDPFVFGRGGEEAIHLKANNIPFEIIPGITAGVAAAASAGIPVTHRGKAVYTIFLTAHESPDKPESQLPWDKFAGLENGTFVGFMGVGTLKDVTRTLIENGMSNDTPAAVIRKGTVGTQETVTGTIENIASLVKKRKITPPALFIFGETVSLRDSIMPPEVKPLTGRTVMVTRPGDQAGFMYRELRKYGAEVLPLPTIQTREFIDKNNWLNFNSIDKAWLIFTSENGVRYFFRQYYKRGYGVRGLGRYTVAVIGEGTRRALYEFGLKPDFMPEKFTVKALAEELARKKNWENVNVIRVRGNLGDYTVEDTISGLGGAVLPLKVYETFTAAWDNGMQAAFDEANIDAVTFTSGSTVTGLVEILGEKDFKTLFKKAASISIGPMTSGVLRDNGVEPSAQAEIHHIEGVVQATLEHFK